MLRKTATMLCEHDTAAGRLPVRTRHDGRTCRSTPLPHRLLRIARPQPVRDKYPPFQVGNRLIANMDDADGMFGLMVA